MSNLQFIFYPIIAGGLLATQLAIETKNRVILGNPYAIAVMAFLIAFLFSVICLYAYKNEYPIPTIKQFTDSNWLGILLGGLMGGVIRVVYLVCMIRAMVPSALGFGKASAVSIAAYLAVMVASDHFGWVNLPQKTDELKLLGYLLVLGGVLIVMWKRAPI